KDRFPVHKILNEDLINNSSLHPTEKEKLIRRAPKYSDFNYHYGKINKSSVFEPTNKDVSSIINSDMKRAKVFETLSYHITELNEDELKEFLVRELEDLETKGEIRMTTELRRLILL